MDYKKFRWSKVYESSEEELVDYLASRNIQSTREHIEADSDPTTAQGKDSTTLWCAEGSMSLTASANTLSLQPGDAVRIEAAQSYTVQPGLTGCTYYLSDGPGS